MNKFRKALIVVFSAMFLVCTALFAVACGGDDTPEEPVYYTVAASYNPDQGSVTLNPGAGEYEAGTEITATVTANAGYEVFKVLVNATTVSLENGACKFTLNSDTTVTAVFRTATEQEVPAPPAQKQSYTVTASAGEGGTVTLSPASTDGKYEEGTEVTAIVTANNGYQVAGATLGGEELPFTSGTYAVANTEGGTTVVLAEGKYTFTVTGNGEVKATFNKVESVLPVPETHKVTLDVMGDVNGNSAKIVPGGDVDDDTVVSLYVTVAAGYKVTALLDGEDITDELTGNRYLLSYTAVVDKDLAFEVIFEKVSESEPPTPSEPELVPGEKVSEPTNNAIVNSGKSDAARRDDTFMLWWVQDTSWNCGAVVDMDQDYGYENGTLTFSYVGGDVGYSVQLFYLNNELEVGEQYYLIMNMTLVLGDVAVAAEGDNIFTVTINGEPVEFVSGVAKEVKVLFTNAPTYNPDAPEYERYSGMYALDIQFPGNNVKTSVSISDVAWYEVVEEGGNVEPATKYLVELEVVDEDNVAGNTATLSHSGEVEEGTEVTLTVTVAEGYTVQVRMGRSILILEDGKYTFTLYKDTSFIVTFTKAETVYEATEVEIIEVDGTVYFVIKGTYEGHADVLKAMLEDASGEGEGVHPGYFDFQSNPYYVTGDYSGDWARNTFTSIVTVENGEWTIQLDISGLASYAYTAHFGYDGSKSGDDRFSNLSLDASQNGKTYVIGGKTYTIVSVPNSGDGKEFWGAVGLVIYDGEVVIKNYSVDYSSIRLENEDGKPVLVIEGSHSNCTEEDFVFDLEDSVTYSKVNPSKTVTLTEDHFVVKIDLSEVNVIDSYYFMHLIVAENGNGDLEDANFGPDKAITVGTKQYTVGITYREDWGGRSMITLKVEAQTVPETYTVTVENGENGTYTLTNGDDVVVSGSKVVENTVLTLTVAPNEGYEIDAVTVNGTLVTGENGVYEIIVTAETTVVITYKEVVPESKTVNISGVAFETYSDSIVLVFWLSLEDVTEEQFKATKLIIGEAEGTFANSSNLSNLTNVLLRYNVTNVTATNELVYLQLNGEQYLLVQANVEKTEEYDSKTYTLISNDRNQLVLTVSGGNTEPPAPETYTVTYVSGVEGITAPVDEKEYEEGEEVTVLAALTREGYTFEGWNDGTTTYQPGDKFDMPAENVTLTAVWEEITYTVTVVKNIEDAGTVTVEPQGPVTLGTTITITVTVNDAYEIVSVTANGHVLELVDGKYTYEVGNSDVEIIVTFSEIVEEEPYEYDLVRRDNSSVVKNPGVWGYTTPNADIVPTEAKYEDGVITFSLADTATSGNYQLRYQPEFENGTTYYAILTIRVSAAATIVIGRDGVNGVGGGTQTINATTDAMVNADLLVVISALLSTDDGGDTARPFYIKVTGADVNAPITLTVKDITFTDEEASRLSWSGKGDTCKEENIGKWFYMINSADNGKDELLPSDVKPAYVDGMLVMTLKSTTSGSSYQFRTQPFEVGTEYTASMEVLLTAPGTVNIGRDNTTLGTVKVSAEDVGKFITVTYTGTTATDEPFNVVLKPATDGTPIAMKVRNIEFTEVKAEPEPETYNVTVEQNLAEAGSVTVTTEDGASVVGGVVEGTKLIITVTTNPGYELVSVKANDHVLELVDGKYTYEVNSEVEIVVEFKEVVDDTLPDITSTNWYTVAYTVEGGLSVGEVLTIEGDLIFHGNVDGKNRWDGVLIDISTDDLATFKVFRYDALAFSGDEITYINGTQSTTWDIDVSRQIGTNEENNEPIYSDWATNFDLLVAGTNTSVKMTIVYLNNNHLELKYEVTGTFTPHGYDVAGEHTLTVTYLVDPNAETVSIGFSGEDATLSNGKLVRSTVEDITYTASEAYENKDVTIGQSINSPYAGNSATTVQETIEAGDKLVVKGTLHTLESAWEGFAVLLSPYTTFNGRGLNFRTDNLVTSSTTGWVYEAEDCTTYNFHVAKSFTRVNSPNVGNEPDINASVYWGDFNAAKTNCDVIITIDWTNEDQIVITYEFLNCTVAGYDNYSATQTYTVTALDGSLAAAYNLEIRPDRGYLENAKATLSKAGSTQPEVPEVKKVNVTLNAIDNLGEAGNYAELSATEVEKGTDVTLTVHVAEGYTVTVLVGGVDVTEQLVEGVYTFEPEADTDITVIYAEEEHEEQLTVEAHEMYITNHTGDASHVYYIFRRYVNSAGESVELDEAPEVTATVNGSDVTVTTVYNNGYMFSFAVSNTGTVEIKYTVEGEEEHTVNLHYEQGAAIYVSETTERMYKSNGDARTFANAKGDYPIYYDIYAVDDITNFETNDQNIALFGMPLYSHILKEDISTLTALKMYLADKGVSGEFSFIMMIYQVWEVDGVTYYSRSSSCAVSEVMTLDVNRRATDNAQVRFGGTALEFMRNEELVATYNAKAVLLKVSKEDTVYNLAFFVEDRAYALYCVEADGNKVEGAEAWKLGDNTLTNTYIWADSFNTQMEAAFNLDEFDILDGWALQTKIVTAEGSVYEDGDWSAPVVYQA